MPLYILTNHLTHARAIVIARDEKTARRMRPDGAIWHDNPAPGWYEFNVLTSYWRRALALECWPDSIELVSVDLLASRVESRFDVVQDVVCFNSDDAMREEGEGPDAWFEPDSPRARALASKQPGEILDPCPECGEPLRPCPSGRVCSNGHGF